MLFGVNLLIHSSFTVGPSRVRAQERVCALVDVVATKLGIILFLLLLSFHLLFSQKGFAYDLNFCMPF